jgi:hypothetical protein
MNNTIVLAIEKERERERERGERLFPMPINNFLRCFNAQK